jgi:hypothetical protein
MRRLLILILIFIGLLAIPLVARQLRYYKISRPDREAPPEYSPVNVPSLVPTPSAGGFKDDPSTLGGKVLLDRAHNNAFTIEDISELDRSLASRGVEFSPIDQGDLASALRAVSSYVVIAPLNNFTTEEVQAVVEFVESNGRLLLVGDPTRFDVVEDEFDPFEFEVDTDEIPLNSLSNAFDIVFNGDYLYNTVENEGNFRNIILKLDDTRDHSLIEDVEKLVFYGAHSVTAGPSGRALLTADDNTWSSATDRPGDLNLAVLGVEDQVLALGDINFLDAPYSTVFDNGRFIAHVADFLVGQGRKYELADFPYFFQPEIDLVYVGDPELGADAFDEIIALQDAFRGIDRTLTLADEVTGDHDAIYLGLYNQAQELETILDDLGIALIIDPPIEEDEEEDISEEEDAAEEEDAQIQDDDEGENEEDEESSTEEEEEEEEEEPDLIRLVKSDLGNIQMSGTALILLVPDDDQQSLIVLTAGADGLENTIGRLIELVPASTDQGLSDCLLQGSIALCPTGVDEESVEEKLETGGIPEVPEEEPAEEEEEEIPEDGEELSLDFDAELQGEIAIDEEIEDTLEPEQAHAWTFSQGPALINIILLGDDETDSVLELYGPDAELLGLSDSSFSGGEERLDLTVIPADGDYTIVVRDFFDDGGSYTLTVEAVRPSNLDIQYQGELSIGESVVESLEETDIHAWSIEVDEPAAVTITLEVEPALDGVIALFDPDGNLLSIANDSGPGLDELMEEITLDTGGEHSIVVGSYNGTFGEYTLILE